MSAPLVPSPLDYLGYRKFVLYPAIANAGPNEWLRGKSSWSATQLVNAVTGQELWVPWQYICGVSDRPGLDLVVELKEDLECHDGNVSPRVKRVIPMPVAAPEVRKRKQRREPAPVIAIKTEDEVHTASNKASRILLVIALACVVTGLLIRVLS